MGGSLPFLTNLAIAARKGGGSCVGAAPRASARNRGSRWPALLAQANSERARERAAVDQQILAGDVAGLSGAQERARRAELVRIAEALRRRRGGALGARLLDRDVPALRGRLDVRLQPIG